MAPEKCLSEDPCCKFFSEHRVPHFCSPPWIPLRGCWKSAAAAAHDLIRIEVDGKWQFVYDTPKGTTHLAPKALGDLYNRRCKGKEPVTITLKFTVGRLDLSVQFSCSVVSNSLRSHGLQHARLPCPSPTPGACSNSCPSSRWCHPTISPSVIHFSSFLQSFPVSGSFPVSQFFISDGQSVGVSASASVLPMNI